MQKSCINYYEEGNKVMKAILISVRPQWAELILNLIKKDEIRKGTAIGKAINKLIEEQGVAPMLMYCTKDKKYTLERNTDEPYDFFTLKDKKHLVFKLNKNHCGYNGKVLARFNATVEHIEYETCSRDISGWWKDDGKMYDHKDACLTYKEMFDYVGGGEGSVIHIDNLKVFDKPKELREFKTPIMAERYKRDLEKAYEDDCEISARLAEGIANDDECANCVELTEMSEGYYGLARAPESYCYIEIEEAK